MAKVRAGGRRQLTLTTVARATVSLLQALLWVTNFITGKDEKLQTDDGKSKKVCVQDSEEGAQRGTRTHDPDIKSLVCNLLS